MLVFQDNRLSTIRDVFERELGHLGPSEARSVFRWCAARYLGIPFAETARTEGRHITESEILHFNRALKKLRTGVPVQYVLEEAWFADLRLRVTPDVLIPRPETEELVMKTLERVRGQKIGRVLDWCTGSGCIPLAIKKMIPQAEVRAYDFSEAALQVAVQNMRDLTLPVVFEKHDALNWESETGKYDLILSNPPYIPLDDKERVQWEVDKFEPRMALYVAGKDALVFYRHIAKFAQQHIAPGGVLAFEVHPNQVEALRHWLQNEPWEVEVGEDLYDRPRFAWLTPRV